jgi:hypothetical protein
MERLQSSTDILRKVAIWTLIGFGVILLSGPILTVLGIVLPFAVVGFLVWLGVKAVLAGPRAVGRAISSTARVIVRGITAVPRWVGARLAAGGRWIGRVGRGAVVVSLPVLAGTFLGALLGAIGGMQYHDADFRIPAGAAIGAGVGLLAAVLRSKREKIPVLEPVSDGLRRA